MLECIIIGSGPGGLVCAKELIEHGIENFICLEQAQRIGGVFTQSYDNLMLTSSTVLSMFSDFWVGDGNEHKFWTKDEALQYWEKYAQNFGVTEYIQFNSEVTAVHPNVEGDGWSVRLRSDDILESKRIVLATGNNAIPSFPSWKERLTNIEVSHSAHYKNPDEYTGKNVLVVGGGESGADIALEIARVAKSCQVSLRSATGWVIPRKRTLGDGRTIATDAALNRLSFGVPGKIMGNLAIKADRYENDPIFDAAADLNANIEGRHGIWGIFGTKNHSLPKAIVHHNCRIVSEVTRVHNGGRTLETSDGEILKDLDAVVLCTGYKNYIPFLPEQFKKTHPRTLYKNVFHPDWQDRLAWIGWARPHFGSQFPLMEMQARMFSMVCAGELDLPTSDEMKKIVQRDEATCITQFGENARRVRSLVDFRRYMDDIADLIGCRPTKWKYLFSNPRIWFRIVAGPFQGTQFRLRGPGSKTSLAQELLMKLPVVLTTKLVLDAVLGRRQPS